MRNNYKNFHRPKITAYAHANWMKSNLRKLYLWRKFVISNKMPLIFLIFSNNFLWTVISLLRFASKSVDTSNRIRISSLTGDSVRDTQISSDTNTLKPRRRSIQCDDASHCACTWVRRSLAVCVVRARTSASHQTSFAGVNEFCHRTHFFQSNNFKIEFVMPWIISKMLFSIWIFINFAIFQISANSWVSEFPNLVI